MVYRPVGTQQMSKPLFIHNLLGIVFVKLFMEAQIDFTKIFSKSHLQTNVYLSMYQCADQSFHVAELA